MAKVWGVILKDEINGTYKPRHNSALAEDIHTLVCKANLDWESRAGPIHMSDTRTPSRVDAEAALAKAITNGAANHGAATETHA